MQHESDLRESEVARKKNPKLLIGLVDPRGKNALRYAELADFIVVNSIEKRDYFVGVQPNVHLYYEYSWFGKSLKVHNEHEPIIIGYHGNKLHLAEIFPQVRPALGR